MIKTFRKKITHDIYFLHIANITKLVISNGNHRVIEQLSDGNIGLSTFKICCFCNLENIVT